MSACRVQRTRFKRRVRASLTRLGVGERGREVRSRSKGVDDEPFRVVWVLVDEVVDLSVKRVATRSGWAHKQECCRGLEETYICDGLREEEPLERRAKGGGEDRQVGVLQKEVADDVLPIHQKKPTVSM